MHSCTKAVDSRVVYFETKSTMVSYFRWDNATVSFRMAKNTAWGHNCNLNGHHIFHRGYIHHLQHSLNTPCLANLSFSAQSYTDLQVTEEFFTTMPNIYSELADSFCKLELVFFSAKLPSTIRSPSAHLYAITHLGARAWTRSYLFEYAASSELRRSELGAPPTCWRWQNTRTPRWNIIDKSLSMFSLYLTQLISE